MFTDLDQVISRFSELLSQISLLKGILFVVFFFAVWFLPAIAAFFLNRKHFRKILAANIPAGLSWIAWVALLAWAVTGKMRGKGLEEQEGVKIDSTQAEMPTVKAD
ncbi:superinfection immunity protein [Microbulbifer sp. CnH-101-G]|uniref:superinfection immunity protein n=1 Tax=Microbulbifer sp. CnH-101-G TaxID=3243393 RepID=UPI0040398257